MTQADFDARSAKLLRAFERKAKADIDAARQEFREEHNLIYVRKHTVEAYFRRRTFRKRESIEANA